MAALGSLFVTGRMINLGIIMAAAGIRGVGQWLFVFILIRVGGPESVGEYGLATAIVMPIVSLTGLQLSRQLATEKQGEEDFGGYLTLRLIATFLNFVIFVPITWVVSGGGFGLTVALMLQVCALGIVEIYQSSLVQYSQMRAYGVSNCAVQLASWFTPVLVLIVTGSAVWALAAAGIATLLSYACLRLVLSLPGPPPSRWEIVGAARIFKVTWPLGVGLCLDLLAFHAPRFVLNATHGTYDLGIFVGLLTFLSASQLISDSVGQAVTPWISRLVHSGNGGRFRLFRMGASSLLIAASLLLALAVYWKGSPVAGFVLGSVYADYPVVLAGVALMVQNHSDNRSLCRLICCVMHF